jgi:hypothetical protein
MSAPDTPIFEGGRKVPYSDWPTDRLRAALAALETRRDGSSRNDFGIIGHAGKIKYVLYLREHPDA